MCTPFVPPTPVSSTAPHSSELALIRVPLWAALSAPGPFGVLGEGAAVPGVGGVLSALGPCGSEHGTQFSLPGSRLRLCTISEGEPSGGVFPRLSGAEFPKLSPRGHRGGRGPGGWGSSVPPPAVEAPAALQQARAVSGIALLAGIIALVEGSCVGPRVPRGGVARERRRSGAVAAGVSRSPGPSAVRSGRGDSARCAAGFCNRRL